MPEEKFIDADFVAVYEGIESDSNRIETLVFGERVTVVEERDDGWTAIEAPTRIDFRNSTTLTGFVRGTPFRDSGVLGMSMVDVQQGDGLILETPNGKTIFIDGGDNKLFARHAAARFRYANTTKAKPLEVDAIIITHGDGDHFDGLNKIRKSETLTGNDKRKRLFIHPKRIFHNGLVKGPSDIKDSEIFGATVTDGEHLYVTDLYDDPRDAPEGMKNKYFKAWHKTLDHWEKDRDPIELKRVAYGMDETELFDFLFDEGISVELQGPFETLFENADGGEDIPTLPYFHKPKASSELHLDNQSPGTSHSASHTINGHSIAMRLSYGNVRFNLTGDLNQEAMKLMRDNLELDANPDALEAEIVKAPHHGSHDFDFKALKAMRPIVAICSSGDEHAGKEHIHPRATLVAALG